MKERFRMSAIVEANILRLLGKMQHYAWGGYTFIPDLIGIKPEPGLTYAEYWMGAHEKAPSEVWRTDGTKALLDRFIENQPETVLGPYIAQKYGHLPFLFKVLDVREMLSIQVHPTKSAAEAGFARENELGISLDAPERNYRDDNHKPELQLALSDFWLLHGFRPEEDLNQILDQVPEIRVLASMFRNDGYYGIYKYIMEMSSDTLDAFLNPLGERIIPLYDSGVLEESSPDYWAAKAMKGERGKHYDRGIFSIYFFNLVHLKPGQALFQDAGVPHALLKGQTLEIMANSDNVIRGGLTPKQVDIPELLKLIKFQRITTEVIEGRQSNRPGEDCYISPGQEFRLSRIRLRRGDTYENRTDSTEIFLNLHGQVQVSTLDSKMVLKRGESFIILADKQYQVNAIEEDASLFRAFIPYSLKQC